VLRACITNFLTTENDIDSVVREISRLAAGEAKVDYAS